LSEKGSKSRKSANRLQLALSTIPERRLKVPPAGIQVGPVAQNSTPDIGARSFCEGLALNTTVNAATVN
jgi:hypothetical protein